MAGSGHRRGIVALRPLGVTEILDGAVRAVWTYRGPVFAISVLFCLATAAVRSLVAYASLGDLSFTFPSLGAQLLLPALLGTPVTVLIAPIVAGAVVGESVSAGDSVRRTARLVPALIALTVVITVAEGVGVGLLLAGGVWLWGIWAVAAPALSLERLGPIAAVKRSSALVRGDFGRVWGARALGWLVTYVISAVALVPFQLLALAVAGGNSLEDPSVDRPLLYIAVAAIGQVIACLLTLPVSSAIDVLLYLDLRMRREGMDIVMALPPEPEAPQQMAPRW